MWTELLENPKALEMFENEPSLEAVILAKLLLDREGPTVTMSIQLQDYPENPPARWRAQENNAVVLELQAIGVENIHITGWNTDNLVSVLIERLESRKVRIRASGVPTEIEVLCGWIRIAGATPYRRQT